ncbi:MAG: hypothetical protein ACR2IH_12945 [Pyrinomonadaceae bacterium]
MSNGSTVRIVSLFLVFVSFSFSVDAQSKRQSQRRVRPAPIAAEGTRGKAVLWEPVAIERRDLFNGPGGGEMKPDVSSVKFIKAEKGGHNKKYKIKDASGREWVAKLGREARPETAAVRLLFGLGYKTEINYLVPTITIPGKGTFQNVRLEARPANAQRLGEWKWKSNPFVGTKPLQGLKMMMVFMTNWDVLDLQNKIVRVGLEDQYIISDLGSTFGRLGNNNLPLFYRLGRTTGRPNQYIKTRFIRRVENGVIELSYKGKSRSIFKGITLADGRWLASRLNRLSDAQILDAFRAANYSPAEAEIYHRAVRNKIDELNRAVGGTNLAENIQR